MNENEKNTVTELTDEELEQAAGGLPPIVTKCAAPSISESEFEKHLRKDPNQCNSYKFWGFGPDFHTCGSCTHFMSELAKLL